jgi:hypothetical protein
LTPVILSDQPAREEQFSMPPKDANQQNIARLESALKQGKNAAKKLQAAKKELQNLQKQSKRLLKE